MAHYSSLHNYRFSDASAAEDIRGSNLYGREDDKLGKIDDVIFDHNSGSIRYIVVDTGGWLSSRKFIVPPQQLRPSPKHKNDFMVDLRKNEIESFPPYDENVLGSEDRWRDYENRYQESWMSDPVQHRKGTDHNITPTATEMPPQPGSLASQISREQNAELRSRIIPAGSDEVTISNSAVGLGDRWSTFESRLRQHRRDITADCPTCSVGPALDRESVETQRKAS